LNTAAPAVDSTAESTPTAEGGERRERRSRDRYGRDRRERAPRDGDSAGSTPSWPQDSASMAAPEPLPVAPAASESTANVPSRAMPRIAAYELPVVDMQAVAQSSGLEWVNSNPERVAAVQAAIAAEPKPVHVPRERPARVIVDEGPLVLVETRKDL